MYTQPACLLFLPAGLTSEHGQVAELQAELARIEEEQGRLPALVQEVQEALEAEAEAYERQEAALCDQEALKERKLGALHQALAMYRERLGLEFVHAEGDGEQLRVVLREVDARDHARAFQFAVQVVGDSSYQGEHAWEWWEGGVEWVRQGGSE
jgi:hypothetical protein